MTSVITRGASSAQALGYAARATAANYIEDVFSTYLYTGTGASQTITNGVDLSTKGGMVWIKSRSAATNNFLFDTARGTTKEINSNTTDAEATLANSLTAFNTDGFTVNSATGIGVNAATYASWTFRKQAKFFDVVTYTGTGSVLTVNHNLGAVPGCIIVKHTNAADSWAVYHRSVGNTGALLLNSTSATATGSVYWNDTTPTSTQFTVGTNGRVNDNGGTYVAYLFAHDAGGFGAAGTDNVISCGSYTGNGSATGPTINLGYEPQFVLTKRASGGAGNWIIFDSMRGIITNDVDARLLPNGGNAENNASNFIDLTATGFNVVSTDADINVNGSTYIYIAIRRGPMKTPTTGTSVYQGAYKGTSLPAFVSGFPVDMGITNDTTAGVGGDHNLSSRLLGNTSLVTNTSNAESAQTYQQFDYMNGYFTWTTSYPGFFAWMFRRAPGFFDVVCYTGDSVVGRTITHNLGVIPQLIICKSRNTVYPEDWVVYSATLGASKALYLNTTNAAITDGGQGWWGYPGVAPTASVFTVGNDSRNNSSGYNYVAYLFATVAGVSKVGSYTGTGTTKQIDCGFTGGARFVLIKRTDSTGDWYVWDSARGIVAGNDPYLLLNSTAAEVTNTDYVDTYSAGFEISSTAPAAINANGGSFIFLAIA